MDHLQTVHLIFTNRKRIKYLTRLRLSLSTCVSIKSNIVFKILWIHFVRVALVLKQIQLFFFTALCLLIKDAPSWVQLMNDTDSSLINTNDSILTHILLFGKASLDISANTLTLNATMKYIISTSRFQESLFLVFCNFLLYFHLLNLFPYPYVFFWDYTFIFIWFLALLLFIY